MPGLQLLMFLSYQRKTNKGIKLTSTQIRVNAKIKEKDFLDKSGIFGFKDNFDLNYKIAKLGRNHY